MRAMLEAELKDAEGPATQEHGIGWQTKDQWQALADMLSAQKALPQMDVQPAFTTSILEAAAKLK